MLDFSGNLNGADACPCVLRGHGGVGVIEISLTGQGERIERLQASADLLAPTMTDVLSSQDQIVLCVRLHSQLLSGTGMSSSLLQAARCPILKG